MKITVTGAAGFIGMHLCKQLIENGHEIICAIDSLNPIYGSNLPILRSKKLQELGLTIENLDLASTTPEVLIKKISQSDAVIHLAANAGVRQSALTPHKYSMSNLVGFANVLEAVRNIKPKLFLFASSSSVYGDGTSTYAQQEHAATGLNLASYYAATKWTNEILAQSHAKNYNINTVALRFFTVYGTYGRPDMAYMTFLDKILKNEPIQLYGQNGGQRSFSHISDVTQILTSILDSQSLFSSLENSISHFEALNIGNNETATARELIQSLELHSEKKAIVNVVDRPSFDVSSTRASMKKTISHLNLKKEFITLHDGIAEFTYWYLNDFLKRSG